MKNRLLRLIVTTVPFLLIWPCGLAFGATISGKASTVIEWFDDPHEESATPFYQYLRMNVKEIANDSLTFTGYGRFATDLSDTIDVDSRLYYAYLEKKGLLNDKLDARLGRQFIATSAGASMMDGLRLIYKEPGKYRITLLGGGDVAYYSGYDTDDWLMGGSVAGYFMDKDLELEISYVMKNEDGDLSHELIGMDGKYRYQDTAEIYTEAQYNFLSENINYFLGGFKLFRHANWTIRSEYIYSLPLFSATSIYSVFAASKYEEFMLEYSYNFRPGLNAFIRYHREMYDEDFDDANVFEAGAEMVRTDKFAGYASGIIRRDADGQDLDGIKLHVSYLFKDNLRAGVGAHIDVLERRLDDQEDDTTSQRYWIDGTYDINEDMNLQSKIERVTSDLWDKYYRGIIRFNISF